MQVLKFGGTSVGSAHGLACVKSLVENKLIDNADEKVVVVVSALGGATDQLIRISKIAAENGDFVTELNALKERHLRAIEDSVLKKNIGTVWTATLQTIAELKRILESVAVLGEISQKTSDLIVSFGERLSAPIVTGIFEDAVMMKALDIFVTKQHFEKHIIDFSTTNNNIKNLTIGKINVCSGFISKDIDGKRITNLGRGGSDFTAAIIAAGLDAQVLEIFTDVDGFLTADPRVVENAKLIQKMDFIDAIELCNYGAKVIYSPTIFPAYHKGIEIKIRNTFNASCLGSSVCAFDEGDVISGISSVNDLSILRVVGNLNGLRFRLYKALSAAGVEVSFACGDGFGVHLKDVKKAVVTLESEFSQELALGKIDKIDIVNNLSMVAVVGRWNDGDDMRARIIKVVKEEGIDILAFGEECSQRAVTFVVGVENVRNAIIATHKLIGENEVVKENFKKITIENIVERLVKAGDVVENIEHKNGYAFVSSKRYRDYPLRIEL